MNMYYEYTKEQKSDLMDAIIEDTIPRLKFNIKSDAKKWSDLYNFLEDLEVVKLSDDEYNSIW